MRNQTVALFLKVVSFAFSILFLFSNATLCEEEYRIGVLAKRGEEIAIREWEPLGDYLAERIDGCGFEIVPLDFDEIFPTVERGEIDFVLSNPSFYVEMEIRYGVSRIATLENRVAGNDVHEFGGVIIVRADNNEITGFDDLKGKSFSAVDKTSFGGWHAAWRELQDNGIDPKEHFSKLAFMGTHDAVVASVLNGDFDAGTVRTDTLERMAAEGRISLDKIRVLKSKFARDAFPLFLSTRLYPEWPIAKLKHTPKKLAENVATALIAMTPESPAAMAAGIEGWTIPSNYQPVHDCLRELRVGPYRDYGKINFTDFIYQYRYFVLITCLAGLFIVLSSLNVIRINRRLVAMQAELRKTGEYLDMGIRKRTAELEASKERLEEDIKVRIQTEEALKNSESRLRTLSRKLLSVQEQERLRLSRELHDELGQKLAGLFLEIEFLKQKKGVDADFLGTARDILKRVNDDLDKLYIGLRPVAIDKLGLSYAIEALVREYQKHDVYDISCKIEKVRKKDIPPNIAIDAYRVAQESMNNIAKHSGADKIDVSLEWKDQSLRLVIKDNGKGFSESTVSGTRGFGLLGMRERVEQHGGTLIIDGGSGNGTTVTATISCIITYRGA